MSKFTQTIIDIEGVKVPLVHIEGKEYLPCSYIEKNLMLGQKNAGSIINKTDKESIIKVEIDFSVITGGINVQPSNCIEVSALAFVLENRTQPVRLSVEQRRSQNRLHRYLGITEMPEIKYEVGRFKFKDKRKYDECVKVSIQFALDENPNVEGKVCSSCLTLYPYTDDFFIHENEKLGTHCHRCKKRNKEYKFKTSDKYVNYLLNQNQPKCVKYHIDQDVESLYEVYYKGKINNLPEWTYTEENFLRIIQYCYSKGYVNESNLNRDFLINNLRINYNNFSEGLNLTLIYQYLFGKEFYYEKWKYPKFQFKEIELTSDISLRIFQNYLDHHDIIIHNPIEFDYQEIIDKCQIKNMVKTFGGLCGFFVAYWNGNYAGYQFRNIGNYYSLNRNNVLSDLRFLVEKDMKLQIEKIPLYVTKQSLRNSANSLWRYIVNMRNGNLFEWFNELYPNQFDETDFEIGRYRNNFDSAEEEQIDGVLRECLTNVIYNYNNSDQVVSLKGKRPDWFVLSESGVWIIEYLGMYIESQINNPIISSYIDSTHEKMKLYTELKSYSTIYLYPSDLLNGFEGVKNKIAVIG